MYKTGASISAEKSKFYNYLQANLHQVSAKSSDVLIDVSKISIRLQLHI